MGLKFKNLNEEEIFLIKTKTVNGPGGVDGVQKACTPTVL